MRTLIRHQLAIFCTAAAVFFIGLGAPKLWDEDEPEYARCTQEMMHRGDLIVPTFNEHLWTDKPVLLYWLIMAAYHVFGQTEFAARFPSALLAVGTALMTYHLGRRMFRPQVGLWAGLIVSTTATFAVIGRAASPDSPLIFCTTLSVLAYVFGVGRRMWEQADEEANVVGQPSSPSALQRFRAVLPQSRWWFVAMYAPLGVAVLAKGPVGVLLPVAALGIWILIVGGRKGERAAESETPPHPQPLSRGGERGVREPVAIAWSARLTTQARHAGQRLKAMAVDFPAATWAMRPFTLAGIVLAVALPWYAAVGIMTRGQWTANFFFHHNVDRFLHPMERHAGSIFYYPLSLMVGFFPWMLALVLGLITVVGRIRRGSAGSRAGLFAVCWTLTWFVVFSLSASKLSHYVAPTYPLLAVIAAIWIADWITQAQAVVGRRLFQWGWWGLAALGVGLLVALPIVVAKYAPGAPSCNWLGLILVAGGVAGWTLQRRGQRSFAAMSLVATAAMLFAGMFAIAAPPISNRQTSVRLVEAVNRFGDSTTPIATYRIRLPDFVYYAGRNAPIMGVHLANASDSRDSVALARELVASSGPIDPYQPDDTRLWLDNLDGALLITDLQGLADLRPILPPDAEILAREPRFLKPGELLLVGRRRAPVSETAARPIPDRK